MPEGGTWRSYSKAREERGELEPLDIGGKEFRFPATPRAEFGLRLYELIGAHEGRIPDGQLLSLLPILLGEDEADELMTTDVTVPELAGIMNDLLREYGYITEVEQSDGATDVPLAQGNRQQRRATAKTSRKKSSSGSRSSKPTSRGSTK